jgi:hypothetical protein
MGNKYLDLGFRERDTLLVAGTARSGTTWVGDVVAHATKSRIIFEPFLLNHNMEFVLRTSLRLMKISFAGIISYISLATAMFRQNIMHGLLEY